MFKPYSSMEDGLELITSVEERLVKERNHVEIAE